MKSSIDTRVLAVQTQLKRRPFLDWLFNINNQDSKQLKQTLDNFNDTADSFTSHAQPTKLNKLRFYYQAKINKFTNNLYHLQFAHKNKPIANYHMLKEHYQKCIDTTTSQFVAEARKIAEHKPVVKNLKYRVKKLFSSVVRDAELYTGDLYKVFSDSQTALKNTGLIQPASELPALLRKGILNHEVAPMSMGVATSSLAFAGFSQLSFVTKDIANIRNKPQKSAGKLLGALAFAVVPSILIGLGVVAWPVTTVVAASLAMAAVGRAFGKAVMRAADYKKTGHAHSKKYALSEERISHLESRGLNRLQIEDLRTFVEQKMRMAKSKRLALLQGSAGQRLKNLFNVGLNMVFGRYFHSDEQKLYGNMMRVLQGRKFSVTRGQTQIGNPIDKLIEFYNQQIGDNQVPIERNMSVKDYSMLTRATIRTTQLVDRSEQLQGKSAVEMTDISAASLKQARSVQRGPVVPSEIEMMPLRNKAVKETEFQQASSVLGPRPPVVPSAVEMMPLRKKAVSEEESQQANSVTGPRAPVVPSSVEMTTLKVNDKPSSQAANETQVQRPVMQVQLQSSRRSVVNERPYGPMPLHSNSEDDKLMVLRSLPERKPSQPDLFRNNRSDSTSYRRNARARFFQPVKQHATKEQQEIVNDTMKQPDTVTHAPRSFL